MNKRLVDVTAYPHRDFEFTMVLHTRWGATITEAGTELERTIGLTGGIAIGIGTIIGAGIFVFPGIAAGQAGPAAAGSFAIGAVVALLVALSTSELATASDSLI